MNKRIFILFVLLIALALPIAVSAQERTLILTEEEINRSFLVTNPVRRSVTDVRVDLQPDQVSISYVVTRRAPRGPRTTTYNVNAIFTPGIEDGRLFWRATSITINGQPASQDLIDQVNASIATSWHNYIRRQLGTGYVINIRITDTEMAITFS